MKKLTLVGLYACLLLSAFTVDARLDETINEIQDRYGKALKGVKPESPATVAGLYGKNGFRIIVGFYQDKSYYEQFQKIDPKKPNAFLEITQAEQVILLKANCEGCSWNERPHEDNMFGRMMGQPPKNDTAYDRSDGLAVGIYNSEQKTFTIRSLRVEKQKEADDKKRQEEEKKRQQENLKGF